MPPPPIAKPLAPNAESKMLPPSCSPISSEPCAVKLPTALPLLSPVSSMQSPSRQEALSATLSHPNLSSDETHKSMLTEQHYADDGCLETKSLSTTEVKSLDRKPQYSSATRDS